MATIALRLGLVLLATWVWLAPDLAAEEDPRLRILQVAEVQANGDILLTHTVRMALRPYNAVKARSANSEMLLREFGVQGQADLYRDAQVQFDDAERSVRLGMRMVGGARNRGRVWHVPLGNAAGQEVLEQGPDRITLLSIARREDGVEQVLTTQLRFPTGTSGVRWNGAAGRVEAEMPAPASNPQGSVRLENELDVRPEIMSCFYKLYGLPAFQHLWVARGVFHNAGDARARDFRVRYRIVNYADWSPWQRSDLLYPGQTAVEAYYPIFRHAVRDLTAETPSVLEVEWSYLDAQDRRVEASETRRISLLGMNQVIYSSMPASEATTWYELFDNAPLIAASFVSHTDPIVQQFAGMAAQVARGAAATADDASALRFMRAVYALMVGNRIAYHSPPGLFKQGVRQHVKFGRDVLRNRAGTCIDLAVLFASTCKAGGLPPYLVVVPGHAFPAVKLPSGKLVPLESTAISVSAAGEALSFEQALALGEQGMDRALAQGAYYLCDIDALRVQGVPAPELSALPPGALAAWGIRVENAADGPGEPSATAPGERVRGPGGLFELDVPAAFRVQREAGRLRVQSDRPHTALVAMWHAREYATLDAMEADARREFTQGRTPPWTIVSRAAQEFLGQPAVLLTARGEHEGVDVIALNLLLLTEHAQLLFSVRAPAASFQTDAEPLGRLLDGMRLDAAARLEAEPAPPAQPAPDRPDARRWEDPQGRARLAIPEGWAFEPHAQGVDLTSGSLSCVVSLRILPRDGATHPGEIAEELAAAQAREQRAKDVGWRVSQRLDGTLRERWPRTSVTMQAREKDAQHADRDEVHIVLGREHRYMLLMLSKGGSWERYLPALKQIYAGFEVLEEPPPPSPGASPVHDARGRYELELPAGWVEAEVGEQDRTLKERRGSGLVVLRVVERPAELRTADDAAAQVLQGMQDTWAAEGGQVRVLKRSRSRGAGAEIACTTLALRVEPKGAPPRRLDLHAFLSTRYLVIVVMAADEDLWMLAMPALQRIWSSLKVHDEPLAGADRPTATPGAESPPRKGAPPAKAPPPKASPAARLPPLGTYADPGRLFELPAPRDWKVESNPTGVNVSSPGGNVLLSLSLALREGGDHEAFVKKADAHLRSTFPRWKEVKREEGSHQGDRATVIHAQADVDGTSAYVETVLVTSRTMLWVLILACPSDRVAAHAALFHHAVQNLRRQEVDGRPLPPLRAAARAGSDYALDVPADWPVRFEGADLVARAPHGDALVVARSMPAEHDGVDALAQSVLERMKARSRGYRLVSQRATTIEGMPGIVAVVEDEEGGAGWRREVRMRLGPEREHVLVLAVRGDLRFKWSAVLERLGAGWKPAP